MFEPDDETKRWAADPGDIDRDDYCVRLGAAILAEPDDEDELSAEEELDAWLQLPEVP